MTEQEIKFIQDNIINFESVKLGFARNIGHDILAQYEQIYRNHLDGQFLLTYWCGSCVLEMLQRLSFYFDNYIESQNAIDHARMILSDSPTLIIETVDEPVLAEPKKKKRK